LSALIKKYEIIHFQYSGIFNSRGSFHSNIIFYVVISVLSAAFSRGFLSQTGGHRWGDVPVGYT